MLTKNDEYFLTVVQSGSLSKAAKSLYMSQPSLTKYIRSLEYRLGIELFDHDTKPLRLMEAGKLYYRHLLKEQEQEMMLLEEMRKANEGQYGSLSIGMPVALSSVYLPRLMAALLKTYPKVRVRLIEAPGEPLQRLVAAERVDLAFAFSPTTNHNIQSQILKKGRVYLATKRGRLITASSAPEGNNPDNGKSIIMMTDPQFLNEFRYVLFQQNQMITKVINRFFQTVHFTPDVLLRSTSPLININLVKEMDGLATFIPSYWIQTLSENDRQNLVFYDFVHSELDWDLKAYYHNKNNLSLYSKYIINSFNDFS